MEQTTLTQLIQLKMKERLGAKVVETPEMKALTEEIAGLFTKQNSALVDEIGQLQQAVTELADQQTQTAMLMLKLVKRINMQDNKLHTMGDVIDEITEYLDLDGECDCPSCVQERELQGTQAKKLEEILKNLPFEVIKVTK